MAWCTECNTYHIGDCPKNDSIDILHKIDSFNSNGLLDKSQSCPACGGTGTVIVPPGFDWHHQTPCLYNVASRPGMCTRCGGTGRI
jgi:hypothetical protein